MIGKYFIIKRLLRREFAVNERMVNIKVSCKARPRRPTTLQESAPSVRDPLNMCTHDTHSIAFNKSLSLAPLS